MKKENNKSKKNVVNYTWIIKISIISFIISITFSFISETVIPNVNIIIGILISIFFITIGIVFDMIGVSVTTADEAKFHSMAAQKISGAKMAIKLKKNAEKVSSFCNDVVGDICGIISGSTGAVISVKLHNIFNINLLFITLLIMGVISMITIGGKAIGKGIALSRSNEILFRFAQVLCIVVKWGENMSNKAFTLIELLGVLVILAIISFLIFPTISSVIDNGADVTYKKQIKTILSATYDFSLKNMSYLKESGEVSYVTLGELKYYGLIDVDIKNPKTKEKFPDNLVISINNVGAGYKHDTSNSELFGDYLYTVELDNLNKFSLQPTIILNGLTKNSNGNYSIVLNLNEPIQQITYSASSKNGDNLTDKVKKYITLDGTAVDNIDNSKSGIYKVNYFVVDEDGYATMTVLNVIIGDNVAPNLVIPSNKTISTNVSSIDLMDGVECSDNSGICDVDVKGSINYGTLGKYIIEYTAKDPSGNTTVAKRVITISN